MEWGVPNPLFFISIKKNVSLHQNNSKRMTNIWSAVLQQMLFADIAPHSVDSVRKIAQGIASGVASENGIDKLEEMVSRLLDWSVSMGTRIIGALLIFFIGRFAIKLVNKLIKRVLNSRDIDPSVKSFAESLVNVLLLALLVIAVINKLGVETTSFAALLASFGVAVGMALSGNLQNLAGGILVLVFRPYKVGDYIEAQGQEGTVVSIQIFHTVIRTYKGVSVYMPNGQMSSNTIVNFSKEPQRMIEWIVGIDYGEDVSKAENAVRAALAKDSRIHDTPAPYIGVKELADSSVNLTIRVWVNKDDYTRTLMDGNRYIYDEFNRQGINFPYPQLTVHQA